MSSDAFYRRLAVTADQRIRARGSRCLLRRNGIADRECFAVVVEYSSRERRGDVILDEDKLALITPVDLEIPPSKEAGDLLVTFAEDGTTEDEVFMIVNKPGDLKQGRIIMYYECQLRPMQ